MFSLLPVWPEYSVFVPGGPYGIFVPPLRPNLMHWLLFIHKIIFSSTCPEPQVLIFRRIQLYTYSIWYCYSLWQFLVACRYTAWVRTQSSLKLCTYKPPQTLIERDSTICCMWHYVPRCRSSKPCLPQQQDTLPHAVKISVLRSWRWAKDCPKHVELILEINKLLLLHLVGSSILLYLYVYALFDISFFCA